MLCLARYLFADNTTTDIGDKMNPNQEMMLRKKLNYYKIQLHNIQEAIDSLEEALGDKPKKEIKKVSSPKRKEVVKKATKKAAVKKAPKKRVVKREIVTNNKQKEKLAKKKLAAQKKIASNIEKQREDRKGMTGEDLLGFTEEDK